MVKGYVGHKKLKAVISANPSPLPTVPRNATAYALARRCYDFYWPNAGPPPVDFENDRYYRLEEAICSMCVFLNATFKDGRMWPGNNPVKFSRVVRIYWDYVLRADPTRPQRKIVTFGYEQLEMEK